MVLKTHFSYILCLKTCIQYVKLNNKKQFQELSDEKCHTLRACTGSYRKSGLAKMLCIVYSLG